MTDRELMQMALETLERIAVLVPRDDPQASEAITALSERLAQPEMQSCAGRNCGSTNPNLHSAECFEDYEKATGMIGLAHKVKMYEDALEEIAWSNNTGGPAFPTTQYTNGVMHIKGGMQLRDYFAAKAMQGMLAIFESGDNIEEVPGLAYAMADAMLKAREEK